MIGIWKLAIYLSTMPAALVPLLVVVFLLHRRQQLVGMVKRDRYIHFNLSARHSSEVAKNLVVIYSIRVPGQVAELHKIRQVFDGLLSRRTLRHGSNFFYSHLHIFSIVPVAAS